MKKRNFGQVLLLSLVILGAGCQKSDKAGSEGASEDGAGWGADVQPYTSPGGPVGQCTQTTANISVPWISQKLSSFSNWSGNMCCGPASVTMVRGIVENRQLTETDLIGTIDWMDTNLPGWSRNGYLCQGTNSDRMVTTIQSYLGLPVQAISTDWCSLLDFLDGNNVVIFHGDTQGGNDSSTFLPGKSHWLVLERVEGNIAYVDDPGRTYASQGNSKAFTLASVRNRFEIQGGLALVVNTGGTCQPNCQGRQCGPDGCGDVCGTCTAGQQCSGLGQCETSCQPSTCVSQGYECGTWSDGCGGPLSCGSCSSGNSCDMNGQCVLDQPSCQTTCDWRECDTYSGCNCGACAYPEVCNNYQCISPYIEAVPASGWTPSFTAETSCTCSASNTDCHTLYVGQVDSTSGNTVQMSFQKTGGGGPSVNVSYWVVVGGDTYPSCEDLASFATRAQGTWSSSQSVLTVPGINVWPDQASFDSAPCGETKKLFIITGGAGGFENTRLYFQRQAVVFTKICN